MRPVIAVMIPAFLAADPPVRGDFTFYGVNFPSRGPRSTGVVRASVPAFPWLSARNVRTREDLDELLGRKEQAKSASFKPAIFYVSKQSTSVERSNLAEHEYFYFLQQDVKARMDAYRWYWIPSRSTLGGHLTDRFRLNGTGLIIFAQDGTVLHVETPVNTPQSVARAMRMIDYKLQMDAALDADLPRLESELEAGNVKELLRYLARAAKYSLYASERTAARLESLRERVSRSGGERIRKAEELAARGERKGALEILRGVQRDFRRDEIGKRAGRVARRIRKDGS